MPITLEGASWIRKQTRCINQPRIERFHLETPRRRDVPLQINRVAYFFWQPHFSFFIKLFFKLFLSTHHCNFIRRKIKVSIRRHFFRDYTLVYRSHQPELWRGIKFRAKYSNYDLWLEYWITAGRTVWSVNIYSCQHRIISNFLHEINTRIKNCLT